MRRPFFVYGAAAIAAGLAIALSSAACNVSAYCFSDCDGDTTSSSSGTNVGGSSTSTLVGSSSGFMGTGGMPNCGDTQTSLENCGACGKKCDLLGAIPQCVAGECTIQACLQGQYDVDGIVETGCEYACPVTDLTPEACDGIDNDCDGLVDAADPDLVAPNNLCNTTPGTPCAATQIVCDAVTGWTCVYPPEVEAVSGFIKTVETKCDGLDGNCDGQVDEWFTTLGDACHDTALGVCTDYGVIVCDPMDATKTTCDLSGPPTPAMPTPEACDGLDNDCNGLVDDALPDSAFDMVAFDGSGVLMDRYEASRADATSAAPGILEAVACSKPSVLPWTGGGYAEAKDACEARGAKYRLCTLAEQQSACRGAGNTKYPYGNAYDPTACNGVDHATPNALPVGSLASCASATSPFDLSGNVAEWTSTQTNAAAPPQRIFALAGGSWLSPEHGLECVIPLTPRAAETTLLPNIGFRCCKDP